VIATAALLREISIPLYQDRLDRNPQDLTGELPRQIRPTFDSDAVALIQGRHLLPAKQQIIQPNLKIQGGPLLPHFGVKILAAQAVYQAATADLPAGYMFQHVSMPTNIDQIASVYTLAGIPLLLTSHDAAWIPAGDCFLASKIEFEMLRGGSAWKQFASTGELIEHLRGENIRGGNDLRVQIHQRVLRPAIDWTVLLLGLPVLLTRPDRHMFWVAGACLGIVGGFTAVVIGLAALGSSGAYLSPLFSTWLPLLVFMPWSWAKASNAMES
jgi:lipopolysaccharide export system permease protein